MFYPPVEISWSHLAGSMARRKAYKGEVSGLKDQTVASKKGKKWRKRKRKKAKPDTERYLPHARLSGARIYNPTCLDLLERLTNTTDWSATGKSQRTYRYSCKPGRLSVDLGNMDTSTMESCPVEHTFGTCSGHDNSVSRILFKICWNIIVLCRGIPVSPCFVSSINLGADIASREQEMCSSWL